MTKTAGRTARSVTNRRKVLSTLLATYLFCSVLLWTSGCGTQTARGKDGVSTGDSPGYRVTTIDKVSKQAGFDVYWLGTQFEGVPLSSVLLWVERTVVLDYNFSSDTAKGPAGKWRDIYIRELDAKAHPEMRAKYESNPDLTFLGEAAIGTETGRTYRSGSGNGVLIFEKGGILFWIAEGNAGSSTLVDIGKGLVTVP